MTNKDKELWETYKRSIERMPINKSKSVKKAQPHKIVIQSMIRDRPPDMSKLNHKSSPLCYESHILDRKLEKSLRQGSVLIDAKLDLHGLTQKQAFNALADFMARQTRLGKRSLLVITGKGRAGQGVLRTNLVSWLKQLPEAEMILALRSAAPHHGGDGAFYILLRKTKVIMHP